jgi:predicted nucleotidyltransferase
MERSDLEARLQTAFAQERVGVVSAYLFGSQASGRAHRESDVDVGVLLDRRRHPTAEARFEERLGLLGRLTHALSGAAVDVVVLNEAPAGLARRIVLDGTALFCSDPHTDRAFRRDVQLLAADLEPFLRRTRSLKLAALAR